MREGRFAMKRLFGIPVLFAGALALAAFAFASAGHVNKHKPNAKGGKLTFMVTTTDHGCSFRSWATDTLKRTYKVRLRKNGSYTVRREDKGRFVTLAGLSPSADPCPGVVRRGKHGTTVLAGMSGKLHGYLQGRLQAARSTRTGAVRRPARRTTSSPASSLRARRLRAVRDMQAGASTSATRLSATRSRASCTTTGSTVGSTASTRSSSATLRTRNQQ